MTAATSQERADPATPAPRPRGGVPAWLLALVPIVVVIALWELWAASGGQHAKPLMPTPHQVLDTFWETVKQGTIFRDALSSLRRVIIGVGLAAVVGIPLGVLMGVSPTCRKALSPSMEVLRPIPIAAWVPLVIVVFGVGEVPAMALIFLGAVFPILLNTIAGVMQTNPIHLRASAMLGASRIQTIRRVVIRSAMPNILVGLRSSIGIGWWVVILAELLAVRSGLGYELVLAQQLLRTDSIIVVIVFIGVIGWAMNWVMERLEKRVLWWML